MVLGKQEREQIAEIVIGACRSQAPRFRSCGETAIGPVYEKIVDNLAKIDLTDPLNHYVEYTARFEARRFFLSEKRNSLGQGKED
jgi:hypothetical protein